MKQKKVGEHLSYRVDFLYWKLINSLLMDGYRVLNISEGNTEIWLEDLSNRNLPIIRVKRYDIDWSNRLRKDMEQTWLSSDAIRKQFLKKDIKCVNIYISAYPPIDYYPEMFNRPFHLENTKTVVRNVLIADSHLNESLHQITRLFGKDLFGIIKQEYDPYEVNMIQNHCFQLMHHAERKEKNLLKHSKPFFTYLFLAIQIIIFILMELAGGTLDPEVLLAFGAKFNPYILAGEWWRFITPIFIHIGIVHLLFNSLALYYLGTMVEGIYGKLRFLMIYLYAGFLGSVASFVFNYNISAGASGAIFGLFGALLYFGIVHKRTFFRTMGMNIIGLIIINLSLGVIVPGIDNAGHIGGLIGGFLAAGIVHLPNSNKSNKQLLFLIITVLIVAGSLYYGFTYPKLPPLIYQSFLP